MPSIVKFSEDCWGGLAVRGHQATKAASGKLSKAHITQPPAYFTSIAAELSSLPTMLINWLFCQSKHSISSHAEHARKCLKVEYLGRIEYDFQKSCVTGPWDHKVSVSAIKVKKKFHACVPLKETN
jgi:hypothetical protein